jgi:putative mRNA 3-end processing factor
VREALDRLPPGARRVLATHGNTEALVQYLCEQGVAARSLATEYGAED